MRLALTSAKRSGRGGGGVELLERDGKIEEMSPTALVGRGGLLGLVESGEVAGEIVVG